MDTVFSHIIQKRFSRQNEDVATDALAFIMQTSWRRLLSILDAIIPEDSRAKPDIFQLRALCKAADSEAFVPFSAEEVTDQRMPAILLQLNSVVEAAVESAVTKKILKIDGLKYQTGWTKRGRYAEIIGAEKVGIWLGIHYGLWQKHGESPLWITFSTSDWGRAVLVRPILEPWAATAGKIAAWDNQEGLAVPLHIEAGGERDRVVKGLVDQIRAIRDALNGLGAQERNHSK